MDGRNRWLCPSFEFYEFWVWIPFEKPNVAVAIIKKKKVAVAVVVRE
jgi:hypothetical protein